VQAVKSVNVHKAWNGYQIKGIPYKAEFIYLTNLYLRSDFYYSIILIEVFNIEIQHTFINSY